MDLFFVSMKVLLKKTAFVATAAVTPPHPKKSAFTHLKTQEKSESLMHDGVVTGARNMPSLPLASFNGLDNIKSFESSLSLCTQLFYPQYEKKTPQIGSIMGLQGTAHNCLGVLQGSQKECVLNLERKRDFSHPSTLRDHDKAVQWRVTDYL